MTDDKPDHDAATTRALLVVRGAIVYSRGERLLASAYLDAMDHNRKLQAIINYLPTDPPPQPLKVMK